MPGRLPISRASFRAPRDCLQPAEGPIATQPALPRGLLGHAGVHRRVEMLRAFAHLATEDRGLRRRDFLLSHGLAWAVGHDIDRGFGFGQVCTRAATHSRGRSRNS